MFFLFKLHFHLLHLFADALVRRHLARFEEHSGAEDKEERRSEEVGD